MPEATRKHKTYGDDVITKDLINIQLDDVDKIKRKREKIEIIASNEKEYIKALLVMKDKIYRNEQYLDQVHENNVDQYSNMLIEINPIILELLISELNAKNLLCAKCKQYTGIMTLMQIQRGDEGAILSIKCARSSCGFINFI